MEQSDWERVVALAKALNSDEALQERFRTSPREVLGEYGIETTDEELNDITEVLGLCDARETERCVVPLVRQYTRRETPEED